MLFIIFFAPHLLRQAVLMARTQELRHLPAEPRGAGGIEERDGAGAEAKREFKKGFFLGGKLLRKRGAASPAAETERAETSAEREVAVVLPEPRREEEEK